MCNVLQLADLKLACFQVFSFWVINSASTSQVVKELLKQKKIYSMSTELNIIYC